MLTSEAHEHAEKLEHYFSRARSLTLVTARNPAFREFYEARGSRRAKVAAGGRAVTQANEALAYLQELFRSSIGEACFIDRSGSENARAVRGEIAPAEGPLRQGGRRTLLQAGVALSRQARSTRPRPICRPTRTNG